MMFSKIMMIFALFNVSNSQQFGPNKISKEGSVCGGMMNNVHVCAPPLECVFTKGPMIADAPGSCKPKCPTKRDVWGNCIPSNCELWDDGCNSCSFKNNKLSDCTEKRCFDTSHDAKCDRYSTETPDEFFRCSKYLPELAKIDKVCCAGESGGQCSNGFPSKCSAECSSIINLLFNNCDDLVKVTHLDTKPGWNEFTDKCKKTGGNHGKKTIPANCATWYDGCNTCSVINGKVSFCTKRMCLHIGTPGCRGYHNSNSKDHEHGHQCFDGKDNDHDGKSDCNDPDCQIYGMCRNVGGHEHGRQCFDGIDNDHDGKKDCADSDCRKDPRSRWRCVHETNVH
jgi:hypothetical protein